MPSASAPTPVTRWPAPSRRRCRPVRPSSCWTTASTSSTAAPSSSEALLADRPGCACSRPAASRSACPANRSTPLPAAAPPRRTTRWERDRGRDAARLFADRARPRPARASRHRRERGARRRGLPPPRRAAARGGAGRGAGRDAAAAALADRLDDRLLDARAAPPRRATAAWRPRWRGATTCCPKPNARSSAAWRVPRRVRLGRGPRGRAAVRRRLAPALAHLVECSLVPGRRPRPRLRLLATTRAFGRGADDGRARRAAPTARPPLPAPSRAAPSRTCSARARAVGWPRLHRERDNLRAALAWAAGPDGDPERAVGLCQSLWHYWDVRGSRGEGLRWLTAALAVGGSDADPSGWRLLSAAALLHARPGRVRRDRGAGPRAARLALAARRSPLGGRRAGPAGDRRLGPGALRPRAAALRGRLAASLAGGRPVARGHGGGAAGPPAPRPLRTRRGHACSPNGRPPTPTRWARSWPAGWPATSPPRSSTAGAIGPPPNGWPQRRSRTTGSSATGKARRRPAPRRPDRAGGGRPGPRPSGASPAPCSATGASATRRASRPRWRASPSRPRIPECGARPRLIEDGRRCGPRSGCCGSAEAGT